MKKLSRSFLIIIRHTKALARSISKKKIVKRLYGATGKPYPSVLRPVKTFFLGRICDIECEAPGAIREYETAIKIRPSYFDALSNLAVNYVQKGDYKKAASYYVKAKKLRPYDERVVVGLGIAYTNLREFDRARKILQTALNINRYNRDTRFYLGRVYYNAGNLNQAIKQTKISLQIDPDNPETHFTLGLYYDKKGWSDMAIAEYRETQRLDPAYITRRVEEIRKRAKFNSR